MALPPIDPPPPTRRGGDVDTLHGVAVPDPYRWLEDEGADAVQAWMTEHDARARRWLEALPQRHTLRERFRALFYYDATSAPLHRGGRLFYSRKHADKEKSILYCRDAADGTERVLIDPNGLSEDGSTALGVWVPSRDGRLLAYALHENNADAATLYVREVDAGRDLPLDVIDGAKYAHPSWLPDGSGFYYTRLPTRDDIHVADLPGHAAVYFHAIGTGADADRLVHAATGNPQTFISGYASHDGNWLVVSIAHGWSATDVYTLDLRRENATFAPLVVGVDAAFHVEPHDGSFYVHTDHEAPRFRVLRARPGQPLTEWDEVVAEDERTLEAASICGGHLVLSYLHRAHGALEIRDLGGQPVRQVPLPGLGTVGGVCGAPDDPHIYYGYTSFTEPTKIFCTAVDGGTPDVWSEVALTVDVSDICVSQVTYVSRDGADITMFLLHKRGVQPTGDNPTILYGYGGFSVSLTPAFAPSLLPWLDAGGVYAVANLRGGGEYGESWHRAGMLLNKQNVFDDFIAAAEWLIENDYTKPEKLAIQGGSNGGLLVGAAMTQRPELFRAVVCAVPLLDMVRFHLFGSGRTWVPEYGSAEDPDQFAAIHAYSPYNHVQEGAAYPAMLMLSADSDDRVDPMHARKFYAHIAHATRSDLPVLLRIERQAGHGGADKVAVLVDNAADTYAFLQEVLA